MVIGFAMPMGISNISKSDADPKNFITDVVNDENNTVVSCIRTKSSNYVDNKRYGKLLYKKR